jgi:hypothetical protein
MTWSTVKSTGRGRWQFRLSIEGWPAEWVTHPSVTHADNADGRAVYSGLSYTGITIRDRVLMMEGKIEADAISFKIATVDSRQSPMASFTLYPEPVAFLQDALSESDTTMVLQAAKELATGVYHVGTEAIEVTAASAGSNTIVRTKWSTLPQKHNVANFDQTRRVAVYDSPPTMEGRRAYLFVYSDGDDLDGNGTCIWRGIVSRPPSSVTGSDGMTTWTIDVQSITAALKQTVAGKIKEVKPLALLYHHVQCPFLIQMHYNGTTADVVYRVSARTEKDFVDDVNRFDFPALITAVGGISEIDWIRLDKSKSGTWRVRLKTNADVPNFYINLGSPLLGVATTTTDLWTDKDGNQVTGNAPAGATFDAYRLQANTEYFCNLVIDHTHAGQLSYRYTGLVTYDGAPMQPLGNASIIMAPASRGVASLFNDVDATDVATFPINRIWIDTDLTDYIDGTIHISDTYSPTGIYKILNADVIVQDNGDGSSSNYYWADLELYTGRTGSFNGLTQEEINKQIVSSKSFDGFITGSTKINVVRNYGTGTTVVGFRNGLVDASVNANDGDTPFITDADLDDWTVVDTITSMYQFSRDYRFITEHSLEDIFAEEFKFVCHFPRVGADGKIELLPLPQFTDATTTDTAHTIDHSGIITPAGSYGAWPSWDPQRDGILTTVNIKDRYNPLKDDWTDKDVTFQDPDAIATHKSRGKAQMSIAPFSAPSQNVHGSSRAVFEQIAAQYLDVFSRDYAIVTLRVPFKHFDVLCGDVCTLTHRKIPAGDGTLGVVSRKALCIERRWDMDPKSEAYGELSFYLPRSTQKGYAPSAVITGQSNTSGNTWAITCSTANALNITVSTNNDGRCLEHFHAADFVRVYKLDETVGTEVTGTVDASPNVAAGTLSVTFGSTWTPSTSTWVLGFQRDTDGAHSTAAQRKFAYVANSGLVTGDGAFARLFA